MSAAISKLPLADVTVVAVEQAVAAPLASRHLADLGARVIKVERRDGGDFARHYDSTVGGLSSYFVWANRSKLSVALDLKHEPDRRQLDAMLDDADVYLHNLAPRAATGLGLDVEHVRSTRPRLVACEISGFGHGGPLADRKAYDLLIQAEAGLLQITGNGDQPAKAGISIADIAAGMYAYSGILAALLQRHRTGMGDVVRVAMLDALVEWMSAPLYYAHFGGTEPQRSGARHATIAPYGPFTTSDSKVVMIGVQNEREWRRFCEIVLRADWLTDDPRFASNEGRVAHLDELEELIAGVFATEARREMAARLDVADIAYANVNDLAAVWDHPQLVARRRRARVGTPVGPIEVLRPPVELGAAAPMSPVPALGEHNRLVTGQD